MDFRVLGPLEVNGGDVPLDIGGNRQQIVLSTLLLNANRVVSTERMMESIYGDRPPSTARSQVQITVSALRRLFATVGCGSVIATRPQGYALQVAGGQFDAQRFADLVAEARGARAAGQPDRAVANYRDALRLWRGRAFAGVESGLVQLSARHLDEQRFIANDERITLELRMGRHHELVSEITELTEEFPFREELRGQLMIALYRCGRTAEALQVYRDTRRIFIDEMGIEPGEQLRRLEHAVLAADPDLDLSAHSFSGPVPKGLVPCLLPADIADFVGRANHVQWIRRHVLAAASDETRLAVPIVVLSGKGGVGKTAIAVHVAHDISVHFPDGQLFADLHGGSHETSVMRVLGRFLRTLGLADSEVPDTIEERAETFRGLVAGRKILILLDDAANEDQVLPLLPGSSTVAVLVTSRSSLAGLAGAAHVDIDVFGAEESSELLTGIIGARRVHEQPEAAAEIAELCGHLPLALRIAGTRLSARRHWSLRQLADRLSDETLRLDELRYGGMEVKAAFSLSYESASAQARRLFRRLAILDGTVFSDWSAAALLDEEFGHAQDVIAELVDAQLIEIVNCQYRFHALIRLYARERLALEESAQDRRAALERVRLGWSGRAGGWRSTPSHSLSQSSASPSGGRRVRSHSKLS